MLGEKYVFSTCSTICSISWCLTQQKCLSSGVYCMHESQVSQRSEESAPCERNQKTLKIAGVSARAFFRGTQKKCVPLGKYAHRAFRASQNPSGNRFGAKKTSDGINLFLRKTIPARMRPHFYIPQGGFANVVQCPRVALGRVLAVLPPRFAAFFFVFSSFYKTFLYSMFFCKYC